MLKKRYVIECKYCGWRWYPNPHNWRNKLNPTSERSLPCPSCGRRNVLDEKIVKNVWKYNMR